MKLNKYLCSFIIFHPRVSGGARVLDQGGQTIFSRAPNFSRSTNRKLFDVIPNCPGYDVKLHHAGRRL